MKHCLLYLFTLFSYSICLGQDKSEQASRPYGGNIGSDNQALSISVYTTGQPITFLNIEDYAGSKTLPGYFRINIKAPPNPPWVLTASIAEQYSFSNPGSMPDNFVSLVSLRSENTGQIVRLSSTPQVILRSSNNLPENDYTVDLIIDPPFNMQAGNLLEVVNFQLAIQ